MYNIVFYYTVLGQKHVLRRDKDGGYLRVGKFGSTKNRVGHIYKNEV